jgi:catechol 2,3-dioxygenase-like lactoylglutathione lyase family enzyme
MQPSGILESAIYADDLDAAEDFYTLVMGLERVAKVEGRHVFFRCGDSVLLVFNPAETTKQPQPGAKLPVPPHGAQGEGHLCFRASAGEIEDWKARLVSQGVAIEADFHWPPQGDEPKGGRSIYFRDPAGNSIEFAEPRIWGL